MNFIKKFLVIVVLVVLVILGYELIKLSVEIQNGVSQTQKQIDAAFVTLNGTLDEQRAYFKKEEAIIDSVEVQTSLGLGLRTLRGLDKSSIGLAQSMANIRSATEKLNGSLPGILDGIQQVLDHTDRGVQANLSQSDLDLKSLDQQIVDTGASLRSSLDEVRPVLESTNQTVLGLNELVRNPQINLLLAESSGTMYELHGTAANLNLLTKPQNLALQAGIAVLKFTGLKFLTSFFVH